MEDVGHARVGEIFVTQDLEREPGGEHGLEAHAVRGDRRDLLPRERGALVGREVQPQSGDREQLVGQDLAGPELARQQLVRLDHPLQRESGEPLDPRVREGVRFGGGHASS